MARARVLLFFFLWSSAWMVEAVKFLPEQYPEEITLETGILISAPFAMLDERGNIHGLMIDLMGSLQQFAKEDSVILTFQQSLVKATYFDALKLVDTTECEKNTTVCKDKKDLLVADYYGNPERHAQVDFTAPWARSSISAMKLKEAEPGAVEINTIAQADQLRAPVCLLSGAYNMDVARQKFPNLNYLECGGYPDFYNDCIARLKKRECSLFVDDELLLRYHASNDPTLEVTNEQFNFLYLHWPMRYDLEPVVSFLLKKWVFHAIVNATLDQLYFQYLSPWGSLCTLGTAGKHCERPCDRQHGKANAFGDCVCKSIRWTGDDCSIEVPEDVNLIPRSLKAIAYVMVALNLLVIAICAAWLVWQRKSAQVRASQPCFLMLVLLGCMISSSTILAMAREDDVDASRTDDNDDIDTVQCMWIPWLYSVGFSVTFGTLFAKIRRVYVTFLQLSKENVVVSSSPTGRNSAVTWQETLLIIGMVLMVDVAILVAWTITDPLVWHREVIRSDQFGAPMESLGYCISDSWKAWGAAMGALHLSLLGVACYMSYRARDIPTMYQEGKFVSIAMISNLQIFVVGVPILIIVGNDPQTAFFVRSVIIWMNDLAVLVCIFGNLIYSTYTAPPVATGSTALIKDEVTKAVTVYAERMRRKSFSNNTPPSPVNPPKPMIGGDADPEIQSPPEDEESSQNEVGNVCPACLSTNEIGAGKSKRPLLVPAARRDLVSSLTMISEVPELLFQPEERDNMISSLSAGSSQTEKKLSRGVGFHMPHFSEGDDEDDEETLPSFPGDRRQHLFAVWEGVRRRHSHDSASLASFSVCDSRASPPRHHPGIAAWQTARQQRDNDSATRSAGSCDSTANVTPSSHTGSSNPPYRRRRSFDSACLARIDSISGVTQPRRYYGKAETDSLASSSVGPPRHPGIAATRHHVIAAQAARQHHNDALSSPQKSLNSEGPSVNQSAEGLDASAERFQSGRRSSLVPPSAPSRPLHLSSVDDETSLDSEVQETITVGERPGVVLPPLPTLGITKAASQKTVPDKTHLCIKNRPPRLPKRMLSSPEGSLGSNKPASGQPVPDQTSLRHAVAFLNQPPELPERMVSLADGSLGSIT
ncbi:acid type B receptor subunit 2 [Seminavis robusta]|uniref:Acid type B receptor subunit 2 n=1 Tax=Seminavis robusta TaxID=568900 RepID=A0A9N8EFH6_9STRA|nr:acid type B receptor subunit 2 [Seminavis robusta]|eukprot:Sro1018_g231830.1 acid type B receptor subunit 2 (1103) ;mRNA; f:12569-16338